MAILKADTIDLKEHPIQRRVRNAQTQFDELLARQSTTFEVAVSEYRRRYRRSPPPRFKEWYEYAVKHESPIIDDFDIINESLTPSWKLSGAEVKRRLEDVRDHGPAMNPCQFLGGQIEGCEYLGEVLPDLLRESGMLSRISDLEILLNILDEPRVLSRGRYNSATEGIDNATLSWNDHPHRQVWDELTAGCDHDKYALPASSKSDPSGIEFADSLSNELDLCRHPEYKGLHGFWRSPMSFHTTNSTVPLLSPGVPSTMGDVPFPAAAYTSEDYMYDESEETAWTNKTAGLYWAGKTTGSFQLAHDDDWKQHHRHRFVALANDLEPKEHAYLRRSPDGSTWEMYGSSFLDKSLYRAKFTDVVQCEDDATCANIRSYYNVQESDPRNESLKYTLNFDTDGNGHSGRYYRLLNSRSLPLKQTVFREWHDERLQPWLHYVPVSLGMEELPEVVRYLIDDEEGRQLAAELAEEGREWSLRALRPVDQVIYLYRLMLELARLQNPDRLAG